MIKTVGDLKKALEAYPDNMLVLGQGGTGQGVIDSILPCPWKEEGERGEYADQERKERGKAIYKYERVDPPILKIELMY